MSEKYERAALQNPEELRLFCKLVHEQNAKSYLEIGSKHGGSLWRIASAMPKGSKIVSVDSPNADGSFKNSMPNLISCVNHLNRDGYKAHLIIGDSTDPETIIKVKDLAPFDVLLIDANHSREFVQSDWNNYGSLKKFVNCINLELFLIAGQEQIKKIGWDWESYGDKWSASWSSALYVAAASGRA